LQERTKTDKNSTQYETHENLPQMKGKAMILKQYDQGEVLDVAGLNEITVLIDRSRTARAELGLNTWAPGQNGPPHQHEAKEQIFFVIAGTGTVRVGDETFSVQPRNFIYVPAGVEHQTIAEGPGPLQYLLFNAFLSEDKEGHATFAEHIAAVKHTRRAQADQQDAAAGGGTAVVPATARRGKHIRDIFGVKMYEFGSNTTHLLLDRAETARCEVTVVSWPAGNKGAMVSHSEKEQTFFVLEGSGEVTVDGETRPVTVAMWSSCRGRRRTRPRLERPDRSSTCA